MVRNTAMGHLQLCALGADYLTSLCLSFFTCKRRVLLVSISNKRL